MALASDNERSSPRAASRGAVERFWPLFAVTWLVFLVTGPVASMLAPPTTPGRMIATLAWTVAFFAAYLWLMLGKSFRDAELTRRDRQVQVVLLLVLTGLVLYVDWANRPGWFWLFIYVVMPAGVVLPARVAAVAVVAVTALAVGVEVARGAWDYVISVPGIALWGFATILLRQFVQTIDELREARVELARLAVADERLRFARDLHDLLGQSLSLITLKSELAGRLLATDPGRAATEVADVERVARQALREVREAVAGYRQPSLSGELSGAREVLAAAGIEAQITGLPDLLPPTVEAVLAWTVREAVTNVIRHSRAAHCEVRVSREGDAVRVEIIDDGVGMAGLPAGVAGSGLAGLEERVDQAGGKMLRGTAPGGGFWLEVTVPIPSETGLALARDHAGSGQRSPK
jgi:two-component system sensor histidine kinase DesK